MLNTRFPTTSWGLTVLRIVTGIVFFMHGWQKVGMGVGGVTQFLTQLGIPGASVAAVVLIAVEVLGGLALILGLGTRYAVIPLSVDMLTAMLTVHLPAGFFVQSGGYELVLLLLAANICLFLSGSGKLALDNLVFKRSVAQRDAMTA